MKYKGVITFDLDGTLISTQSEAKNCFLAAFKKTFNVDNIEEPLFKGGVDLEILSRLCQNINISLNSELKNLFIENYMNKLRTMANYKNWFIHENAENFLKFLKDAGFILVLVSGNFFETGIIKLEKTYLKEYFSFLALNSMEKNRIDLMKNALLYSKEKGLKLISHFGDAYSDIVCAYNFNIPSFLFLPDFNGLNKNSLFNDLIEKLQIENIDNIIEKTKEIFYIDSTKISKIDTNKFDMKNEFSQTFNLENANLLIIFNSYEDVKNNFENLINLNILEIGG